MRKGFASSTRLVVLGCAVLACYAGLGGRLVWLHWLEREQYTSFLNKARKQTTVEMARRGDILDVRGNRLATSRSVIQLGADPQELRPADERKWPELARLISRPLYEVEPLLRRRFAAPGTAEANDEGVDQNAQGRPVRWVKLGDEIEESAFEKIQALGIKGVYGVRKYRRVYPGGSLASHILGYINNEQKPVTGVERHLDFYLRGQAGWCESERDGRRRELARFRSREISSSPGLDAVLTIDMFVQHIVEQELADIDRRFHPESATIIVGDPNTGAILALANWPTFDLNRFSTAPLEAQRNIAITDVYEPGSTFKIVAAAGALNDRLVTPESVFDCSLTSIEYEGKPRSLPGEAHHYEKLTVAEIIGKSSNRGAAQLGMRLGSNRLHQYAAAFGFGVPTGFPFGGEVSGVLHPVSRWDGLTITRLPMGHAVSITPIQIHCAMGVIASGGILSRPWIIREIRDELGRTVAPYQPTPHRRVISSDTAETMARLLVEAASSEGTGKAAAIDGYMVAGKTGTTKKIIDGKYSSSHHIGSFVGFFPADNPQIQITVVVNDGHLPTGGIAYGGVVAAPSFKRIGEQLIPYLGIRPAGTQMIRPVIALSTPTR
jgi:cell division protein FtsI (penicillin-binding protein 3)/stage V sporulation protein D (sporulation-specific penicillin-binding protein)